MLPRLVPFPLPLPLLLAVAACFSSPQPIAMDTDSATGASETATTEGVDVGSDDETSSDEGPAPSCGGASEACLLGPPNGWAGPTFVYESAPAERPSCPSAAPDVSVDLNTGLSAPDAVCGCECGEPLSPVCPNASVRPHSSSTCDDTLPWVPIEPQMCQQIDEGLSYSSSGLPHTSFEGSCEIHASTELPDATWQGALRACIGPVGQSDGCSGDQVCVTQPQLSPSFRVCVHRSGDHSCPLQGYTERVQAYSGFDDARACEDCECGNVVDGQCARTMELYESDDCTGPTNDTLAGSNNQCSQVAGSKSAYLAVEITGECPPSDPAPTGGVVPTGIETLCCLP